MGIPTLISTSTASDASSIAITSGIDSTYDEYMFVCTDIHPEGTQPHFGFQVNASGQSGYNEVITSTYISAYHSESGSEEQLYYLTAGDQAQGTALQRLSSDTGNENDEITAGILHLFSPSNTTYVTHFYSTFDTNRYDDISNVSYVAGYINVTAAITGIEFKMTSGNVNGTIQMYGIA